MYLEVELEQSRVEHLQLYRYHIAFQTVYSNVCSHHFSASLPALVMVTLKNIFVKLMHVLNCISLVMGEIEHSSFCFYKISPAYFSLALFPLSHLPLSPWAHNSQFLDFALACSLPYHDPQPRNSCRNGLWDTEYKGILGMSQVYWLTHLVTEIVPELRSVLWSASKTQTVSLPLSFPIFSRLVHTRAGWQGKLDFINIAKYVNKQSAI